MEKIRYRYWIAKYPVTNAQYARFIQTEGYKQPDYWSEEGWRWLLENAYTQPKYWNAWRRNSLSPVVGISRYEAEAYCNWLTAQASKEGIGAQRDR